MVTDSTKMLWFRKLQLTSCNNAEVYMYILCWFQADAQLEMELRGFREASMKYVLKVQEVQERKKFDFVEIVGQFDIICFLNLYLKTIQKNLQNQLILNFFNIFFLKYDFKCTGNMFLVSYKKTPHR